MSGRRLVSMVALCFCLVGSTSIYAADFHVSAARGQDSGTCGSVTEPCRTILQCVVNAGKGENIIKIAAGSYSESILINYPTAGLTLQGGWDDTFSSRDRNPARTILSPAQQLSPPVLSLVAGAAQTVNLALESLDFRGPGVFGLVVTSTGSSAEVGFSMKNCIIESFTQHGIYFTTSANGSTSVEIEETVVRNNIQAGGDGSQGGAGMRVSVTDGSADITLRKSRFLDNRCLSAAGGLFFQLDGGTTAVRLENSIIAGNYSSTEGGGIYIGSTNQGRMDFNLTNTTIFNNTSESFGGGLRIVANSNVVAARLRNTIIWGNGSPFPGRDISQSMQSFPGDNSGINADYSIIGDVATTGNYTDGGHNLNVDPKLDNTYHLRPGSPAVNAGICGSKLVIFDTYLRIAPYDDIDGDHRPGFGELTGCDIGADELRSGLCFPVRNRSGSITIICM